MTNILLVGVGGFAGTVGRYLISGWAQRLSGNASFPYGTLTVNLIGCLLIGLAAGMSESRQLFSPETRLFLFIGVFGGFTTYSSFGYETFVLVRDSELLLAGANAALHLLVGFGAVWAGTILSRLL